MLKELFESATLLDVRILVMAFFMVVFAAVLIRVCLPSRTKHYRAMSQLPLEQEEQQA